MNKILCLCPIGIGNYLCVYPSIALLKKAQPDAEIHLLALRKGIAEIAQNDSLFSKVYCIDPTKEKRIVVIFKFFQKLAKEKYSHSINLFPSNKWQYNIVPFICGISKRFSFDYPLKKLVSLSFLANCKIPINTEFHDYEQNLKIVKSFLGKEIDNDSLKFPQLFTSDENQSADSFVRSNFTDEKVFGIHPGSSAEHGMDCKRWDPERFGELGNLLSKYSGCKALVFGLPDENELKAKVLSIMGENAIEAPSGNLRFTAALISKCKFFVCNDSGLMHTAASLGVPVGAIFGPTDEKRNGPIGSKHVIIRKQIPGFPIWTAAKVGTRKVPKNVDPQAPLKLLTVNDAWEQIQPWLRNLVEM